MKKVQLLSLLTASATACMVTLESCGGKQQTQDSTVAKALDIAYMDTTVAPGTDFYQYACGGWIKNNPLKPEYSRYGVFNRLRETNQEQLRSLIEGLQSQPQGEGSVAQKISTLYTMGLDSAKLNADGFSPIKEQLSAIQNIATRNDLSQMVAALQKNAMDPFFTLYVAGDETNSSMNIVHFYQAGLGMNVRDYYLQDSEVNRKVHDAYIEFINRLFTLIGATPEQAKAAADAVMKIENGIAEISYSSVVLRDSHKNYNKLSVAELKKTANPLAWDVYFEALGLKDIQEVDVKQLEFFKGLEDLLDKTTIDEQKNYLAFTLLRSAAPYLSDDFATASFDFYGKVMSGAQEQQPRWKRSVNTVNAALGEAVGQMYVAKYFPESSKIKMKELVANLQQALGERIQNLTWMGDSTKAKAIEKLSSFIVKIGYPDKWRDYSGLELENDSYWANVCRASQFETAYQLSFAGKPVDKSIWLMTPQTVNAYYNPSTNEICFPAAILQPPFFNPDADDAVNYGAIGVVIGHEMTHGFDDQGRNYDKDGNLVNWWTEKDAALFSEKANKLVKQYSAIEVQDSVFANGELTLGENIADQGGLLVAHQAYLNSLKGETPAMIDGFTNEQRFYLGYATLWAENIRPEEILRMTRIDPHSLGKWRVNAALRNIDTFYEAFDIKEWDAMYMSPEERVNIW